MLSDEWRLTATYTYLHAAATRDHPSVPEASTMGIEEFPPVNQVHVRSSYDLTKRVQLNASAFYVDQIAGLDVPSYVRFDASVTWMPRDGMEVTAGIQNAFDDQHPEFGSPLKDQNSEIERAVYLQVLWRF
jgi:outer membrane receptor protein involved in Fe transport